MLTIESVILLIDIKYQKSKSKTSFLFSPSCRYYIDEHCFPEEIALNLPKINPKPTHMTQTSHPLETKLDFHK